MYIYIFFVSKIEPKGGRRSHTPIKPLEDSSMTYDESENLTFHVSKLENLIKGSMRMIDLVTYREDWRKGWKGV